MTKNRMEETNGGSKASVSDIVKEVLEEKAKPGHPPDVVEKTRPATEADELQILLWNAYADLIQREKEFISAITALSNERTKASLVGQARLRDHFKMPTNPQIRTTDGVKELVWKETAKKD